MRRGERHVEAGVHVAPPATQCSAGFGHRCRLNGERPKRPRACNSGVIAVSNQSLCRVCA